MSHIKLVFPFVALLLVVGCGSAEPDSPPRALRLSAGAGAVETALPARVSVSFTLDTTDSQPVAGLSADAFTVYEDGAKVSAYESQRAIERRGQKSRMYSLLLLDLSGSILGSGQFVALQDAANAYVNRILDGSTDAQRIAIYGFDGRATIQPIVGFTNDKQALLDGIFSLGQRQCSTNADCAGFADHKSCAGWLCVDESTNLYGAAQLAVQTLDAQVAGDGSVPFKESALVVFTDGTDQAGRASEADAAAALSSSPSHAFTIGLGGEVDTSVLSRFGKDGYEPVAQADALQKAFDGIASRISAMANRFYVLDYCSPKRSGTHELRLSASWTDGTGSILSGSLTEQFDATGFSSGCEISAPN